MNRLRLLLPAALLLALVAALVAAQPSFGTPTTVIDVTASGDATNTSADCTTAGNTTCTLRDAVDDANVLANSGAEILVPAGTYSLTRGQLNIVQPVTLIGAGDTTSGTVIKQTAAGDRVMDIYDPSVSGQTSISGVEITGGTLTDAASQVQNLLEGGGILIAPTVSVDVTLTDDLVTDNTVTGATATGTGLLEDGQTAEGGAIAVNGSSAELTIDGTSVSGNSASGGNGANGSSSAQGGTGGPANGGGVVVDYGALTIENGSTLDSDSAFGGTGGDGGTPTSQYPPGASGSAGGGAVATSSVVTAIISDTTLAADGAAGGAGTGPSGAGGSAGGGAIALNGPGTISDDAIEANEAQGGAGDTSGSAGYAEGGGFISNESAENIAASTFTSNIVSGVQGDGGAIYEGGSGNTIVNSTITGNGGSGANLGGGVYDSEATDLENDTVTANTVASGDAGANVAAAGGRTAMADTVLADPVGGANCFAESGQATLADLTSPGGNLEDDGAASCGFSVAKGDLVGTPPDLGSLANNGGATQTLLPAVGSPVIGAGGACTDPSQTPVTALLSDQRGEPRPTGGPCTIGAVQIQSPADTTAPGITPAKPSFGQTLTCSQGVWTSDGTLNYSYRWLRGGTAIQGADVSTYMPTAADVGHSLTCQVTATSSYSLTHAAQTAAVTVTAPDPTVTLTTPSSGATYTQGQMVAAAFSCADPTGGTGLASCVGTAAKGAAVNTSSLGQHSFTVTATDNSGQTAQQTTTYTVTADGTTAAGGTTGSTVQPGVSGAAESAATFREPGAAKNGKAPIGTTFRFTLKLAGTVKLTFTRQSAGRKVKHRCVKPATRNLKDPRCARTVTLGTLTVTGKAGVNVVPFAGRLSRKPLPPGRYEVTITEVGVTSRKLVRLSFTIVR